LPDRFQAWGKKALALGLPAEDEALQLEWALTLGWKAALTDQVSEPFVQASTYHIFAVDGLRIAIVSGILIALLRTVGVPRLWCGIAAAPFLVFYAAMTGWPASAVRALVMAFIVFGGWTLKRPSDLVNSLLAAVVVILTWEPRQLFQAGFQLSFLVVLCIILITPFFERLRERLLRPNPLLPEQLRPRWQRLVEAPARWTLGLFLASIAAWLGSIPLVAYYFHVFTPVSGPANLLAIPLCALVLICNLSSLLLAPWLPSVAVLFNYSGWFLMTGIVKLSQWFAHWPAAFAYVAMPSPPTMALYYLLLLGLLTGWLLKSGPGRRWKIGVVLVLSATWGVNWCWSLPDTRLTVLPLGGGHGVYLRSPDSGNDVLLDCGDEALADSVTKPFLRAQGVNRLSRFVVTHGEKDFSDGAGLIAGEFRPTTIATSAVQFRSAEYRRFAAALRTNGLNQTTLRPGERLGTLTVLAPGTTTTGGRTYDDALVFRADITGVRVLLLSDLGHVGQEKLLNDVFVAGQTNALRADVVVTSPSGQDEPLGDSLLEAIQPQLVIIADSESVPQRRAGRELRERLATRNVPVIYTGDSGGVTLIIRASRWSARAMDGTRYSGSAN
jgi:competence protein ComEC